MASGASDLLVSERARSVLPSAPCFQQLLWPVTQGGNCRLAKIHRPLFDTHLIWLQLVRNIFDESGGRRGLEPGCEGATAQCHCHLSKELSPGSVSFHRFLSFGNRPSFAQNSMHWTISLQPCFLCFLTFIKLVKDKLQNQRISGLRACQVLKVVYSNLPPLPLPPI